MLDLKGPVRLMVIILFSMSLTMAGLSQAIRDSLSKDAIFGSKYCAEKIETATVSDNDQDPPAGVPGRKGASFHVTTNLITLNATVRDRRTGRAASHLSPSDFLVYEDRVSQEIAYFSPVDAPFHLLLLLDISGSITEKFHIVQKASIQFIDRLRPTDQIAVAVFNSRFKVLAQFTNDRSVLSKAIRKASPGGGTAFYDALHQSVTSVFQGVSGRKAIVIFTDGVDNQHHPQVRSEGSKITFPELFHWVEEVDITIYPIFLDTKDDIKAGGLITGRPSGGGVSVDLGKVIDVLRRGGHPPTRPGGRPGPGSIEALYQKAKEELNQIAEQTGGWMYMPKEVGDLRMVYDQILDELRVQYSLGYYPTRIEPDGKWRRIVVLIKDQPEYVVRTRKGYYVNSGPKPREDRESGQPSPR